MPCFHPLDAYRDGSGAIVFDKVKSLSKISFKLPCGRCIGCKMERARQWGVRCMHEKRMSSSSCFITLTYNDDCLPPGGTLVKRDIQLFLKRLHNRLLRSRGVGIRYFLGAEYGEHNARPHYHALIFNYDFPDKRPHAKSANGDVVYTSAELAELWPHGFNTIGEVTAESAVYCAKYALKKVSGKQREAGHYVVYDADGLVFEREPEFAFMSRNPGIGGEYYEKFGQEVRDHDSVVIDGRECKPPRFYDERTKRVDSAAFDDLQRRRGFERLRDERIKSRLARKRKKLALAQKDDNTPERLSVKERIAIINATKKERKL